MTERKKGRREGMMAKAEGGVCGVAGRRKRKNHKLGKRKREKKD